MRSKKPMIMAIHQLLKDWNNSNNGDDVKKHTDIFIKFIYKMSSAESEIKNAISELPDGKKE